MLNLCRINSYMPRGFDTAPRGTSTAPHLYVYSGSRSTVKPDPACHGSRPPSRTLEQLRIGNVWHLAIEAVAALTKGILLRFHEPQ